jgi:hypothetical protein
VPAVRVRHEALLFRMEVRDRPSPRRRSGGVKRTRLARRPTWPGPRRAPPHPRSGTRSPCWENRARRTARAASADSEVRPGPSAPDATPAPAQNQTGSRAGSRKAGPEALPTSSLPITCSDRRAARHWPRSAGRPVLCVFWTSLRTSLRGWPGRPRRLSAARIVMCCRYRAGARVSSRWLIFWRPGRHPSPSAVWP